MSGAVFSTLELQKLFIEEVFKSLSFPKDHLNLVMSYVQVPISTQEISFSKETVSRLKKYSERGFIWFEKEIYLFIRDGFAKRIVVTQIDSMNLKQCEHQNPWMNISEIAKNYVNHDGWTYTESLRSLHNRPSMFDPEGYSFNEYRDHWSVNVNGDSKDILNPNCIPNIRSQRNGWGRLVKMNDKFYCAGDPDNSEHRAVYVALETNVEEMTNLSCLEPEWIKFDLPFGIEIPNDSWVITSQEWFIGITRIYENECPKFRFFIMDLSHPDLSYPHHSRIICDESLSIEVQEDGTQEYTVLYLCKDRHQDKIVLYLAVHGLQTYWRFIIPNFF